MLQGELRSLYKTAKKLLAFIFAVQQYTIALQQYYRVAWVYWFFITIVQVILALVVTLNATSIKAHAVPFTFDQSSRCPPHILQTLLCPPLPECLDETLIGTDKSINTFMFTLQTWIQRHLKGSRLLGVSVIHFWLCGVLTTVTVCVVVLCLYIARRAVRGHVHTLFGREYVARDIG